LITIEIALITLVSHYQIDAGTVSSLVFVEDCVALVGATVTEEPTKNAAGIFRIVSARAGVFAVEAEHVVAGDGPPVNVLRLGKYRRTFDSGE
jgi:hypothetical protein